jgi:Carboxypeptidase regulatory-like domain/Domain of unknown function (DUF5122) beta-propeller
VQADGKILASGAFDTIGGQTRFFFARLDPATGAADSFNPGANNVVYSITMQADGKILAGGTFINIGGQSRSLLARLTNDRPVLQSLTAGSNSIVWTRDGAQFRRVTFEQSTDNGANYTLLGYAAPSYVESEGKQTSSLVPQAAGYTLTGLNLPTGQPVLIRARGYYQSGYRSGSENTQEYVKSIYLLAPTAASVSISGRVLSSQKAIVRATVWLTDSSGNIRTAKTNSFGYFRFDGIRSGETVTLQVTGKGYSFAPQIITLVEDLTDFDFNALE